MQLFFYVDEKAVKVATEWVSNIVQNHPDDMQLSLRNHYLDTGEDKYLVVVRSVQLLLGQEKIPYPY